MGQVFYLERAGAKMINRANFVSKPKGLVSLLMPAFAVGLITLTGCVDRPPKRDEIPHIKEQLGKLEKFYRGEYDRSLDSLLTGRFYAEMGKQGQWGALNVDGVAWPFHGFANRSFFYTKKIAEVDLKMRYRSPDSTTDSLLPVKIRLNHEKGQWLVEKITPQEPIGF